MVTQVSPVQYGKKLLKSVTSRSKDYQSLRLLLIMEPGSDKHEVKTHEISYQGC